MGVEFTTGSVTAEDDRTVFTSGGATAFENEADIFVEYAEAGKTEFSTGSVTAFEDEQPGRTVFTTGGVTAFDNESEVFPQYSSDAKDADKVEFTAGSVGDD